MTVSAIQKNKVIAASNCGKRPTIHVRSEKVQPVVAPFVQGKIEPLCPEIFGGKVRTVRRQLAESTYDTKRRLDVAFDRLLDELFGQEDKTRTMTVCRHFMRSPSGLFTGGKRMENSDC